MVFDTTDWSIDRQTGDIRYIGDAHGGASPTYATVIEFHRGLQDFADDLTSAGDDELDITDNIITLINGFNIDDASAEHLYDGSIIQDGGDTIYDGLLVVGTVETGTELQLVQDNAIVTSYWGTGLNADAANNILLRIMHKVRADGVDINRRILRVHARELSDSYAEFRVNGTARGNNVFAISTANDLNNQTAAGTIATWDQFNNTEGYNGLDVDNDTVNEFYYSDWDIGGGTLPATPTVNDLYEYTKWIQRRGTSETIHAMNGELFRGITHSFAYDNETGGSPSTNDIYAWGTAIAYDNEAVSTFQVGEAVHEDTATPVWKGRILAVDDNGTTGTLIVDVTTGTVTDNDTFTAQTSGTTADVAGTPTAVTGGGTVALLAVDDQGTTGNLYVQLLKGSAPVDDTILYDDTDAGITLQVNGTVTQRTVSPEFIGTSTGSAIIGAYGLGIEPTDLSTSDILTALDGNTYSPPNFVTFTVFGLVSGEDTVHVATYDGVGGPDFDQYSLNTSLTTDNITSVVVTPAIESETPADGYIRVFDDNGFARRLHYSSWTGSTFTIDSTDGQEDFATVNATAGNDVYTSYLDIVATGSSESFTYVFNANRTVFVRVRDGGASPIKTFETTATVGSGGGSATAIRTSDA